MADNKKYISVKPTRLSSGVTSTDTSFSVAEIKDIAGNDLTASDIGDLNWGVFEPESSEQVEFFTWTGFTGTSITGVTRGILPKQPYTENASYKRAHAAGVRVVLFTNAPDMYDSFANKDNDETITETWTFTNPNYPRIDSYVAPTADEQFAPKKYIDDIAIAGAPDATTTVKGIVEIATSAESQAGTDTGGTGASLVVLPSDIATNIQEAQFLFAADAGGTDAYAITIAPAISAYTTGQSFYFTANTANTGAATLDVNGVGAITIKKFHDQDLEDGDIESGSAVHVIYDGTNFQLQTPLATNLSTAVVDDVNSFFADPKQQQITINETAAQDIAAGDLVAMESDGLHRVRATDIGTEDYIDTTDTKSDGVRITGRIRSFDSATSLRRIISYLDDDASARRSIVGAYDFNADFASVSAYSPLSASVTAGIAGDVFMSDVCQFADDEYLVVSSDGGDIDAVYVETTGALSQGAAASISTTALFGVCAPYDATEAIVWGYNSGGATGIQAFEINLSGTTISVGTTSTFISSSNSLRLHGAARFGTSDFYGVLYSDGDDTKLYFVIGEYDQPNGNFSAVGTPLEVESAAVMAQYQTATLVGVDDTHMAIAYVVGSNAKVGIYSRSSTTATEEEKITLTQAAESNVGIGMELIGSSTLGVCYEDSANTSVAFMVEIERDLDDITQIDEQGLAASNGGGGVIELYRDKWAFAYELNSTSDINLAVYDLTVNVNSFIGAAQAAIDNAATGDITVNGYEDTFTGLTQGTPYYVDYGGDTTSDKTIYQSDNQVKAGVALSATEMDIK